MTRNEILTRIVLANGGIVTNSDNENSLLNDWLLAVSSDPEIARYFTTFDSVAQTYISLSSPVTLSGDFEIEFFSLYRPDYKAALNGDIFGNNFTIY